MKKTVKNTLAVAMTAATLLAVPAASMGVSAVGDTSSVQTASASSIAYVEDHSVVDCTHYYKENGNYYFQIKCPKGQLDNVSVQITKKADGTMAPDYLQFRYSSFTTLYGKEYAYSDDNYDYVWFSVKYGDYPNFNYPYESEGVGIQIFYHETNDDTVYMATNTSNYSTVRGRGYFLSK